MTFNQLSNEAKLLFVIGEPLRRDKKLSSTQWVSKVEFLWKHVTAKTSAEFRKAFLDVAMWLETDTATPRKR